MVREASDKATFVPSPEGSTGMSPEHTWEKNISGRGTNKWKGSAGLQGGECLRSGLRVGGRRDTGLERWSEVKGKSYRA